MSNLKDIKLEIEKYANDSNLTELHIVEKLENHYFNKKVNDNLKLYKKEKKSERNNKRPKNLATKILCDFRKKENRTQKV